MSTIVNNPGDGRNDNGSGWIIAIVVIVVLLLLAFLMFGADDVDDARDAVQNIPQQVEDRAENVDVPTTVNNTFNSTTTINNSTTTPR